MDTAFQGPSGPSGVSRATPEPIINVFGDQELRELFQGGLDVYRPLLPLVLGTSEAVYQSLSSRGVLRRQQGSVLGDDVVVVWPEELSALVAQFRARGEVERHEIVSPGSVWKYHDRGKDLGTRWRRPAYDDGGWKEGKGELGYGDAAEGRPEATVLSYGDDSNAKHMCYYFRRTFTVEKKAASKPLLLEVMVDDGCVVYVNGKERFRINMPEGDVAYATPAGGAYGGSSFEAAWKRHALPTDVLLGGKNTIAVEVHQGSPRSSDVSFDLKLAAYRRK